MTGVRQSYWATQSAVTDPGRAGTAIDELPADLEALRQASSQLVFHYWRLSSPSRMGTAGRRPRTFGIRDFDLPGSLGGHQDVAGHIRLPSRVIDV